MSVFVKRNATLCAFASSDSWVILSPIEQSIKRKIEAVGTPLKDWDIQINYGIKTGCNEAFIIDEAKRSEILGNCRDTAECKRTDALIRPILRGRDIKRYAFEWAHLYIIATFPARHLDIEAYPAVKKHLLSFGIERLEQTGKEHIVNGERIKSRKKSGNKWFETQDAIAYMDDFAKPKIVWMDLSDVPTFAYDCTSKFANNTVYFLSGKVNLLSLLGYLNSKMATYLFSQIGSTSGVGTTRWQAFTMERLFIPQATPAQQTEIADLVSRILAAKADNPTADTAAFETQIDTLIYHLYRLTDEEIAIVEKR